MAQRTLEGHDGSLPSTVEGFPHTPTHRCTEPDELLLTAGAAGDSHYASSDGLTLPSSPQLAHPKASVGEHSELHFLWQSQSRVGSVGQRPARLPIVCLW